MNDMATSQFEAQLYLSLSLSLCLSIPRKKVEVSVVALFDSFVYKMLIHLENESPMCIFLVRRLNLTFGEVKQ